MNKSIIIDGVDVAGCEHRSDTHKELLADGAIKEFFNYCYISNDGCYGVNCYYKQLQRLKAENKLLEEEKRDKIKLLEQVINILYPDASDNELYDVAFNIEFIDKLKQLKAENEELKLHNNTLVYNCEKFKEGNIKLKQALDKIKVIALDIIENDCYENSDTKAKNIIDKINEVLKDE